MMPVPSLDIDDQDSNANPWFHMRILAMATCVVSPTHILRWCVPCTAIRCTDGSRTNSAVCTYIGGVLATGCEFTGTGATSTCLPGMCDAVVSAAPTNDNPLDTLMARLPSSAQLQIDPISCHC